MWFDTDTGGDTYHEFQIVLKEGKRTVSQYNYTSQSKK